MKCLLAVATAAAVVFTPGSVAAQGNPLMDSVKAQMALVKGVLIRTAEKVPEPIWAFQPTPEVRTFGQIIGHIADANLAICGAAGGDKATPVNAEKSLKTKAELSKALADSFAYCEKIAAGMDDKKGLEVTKFFGQEQARAMVLAFNNAHDYEHYGNLVTYMRINKIVPPSSEKGGMD